MSEVDWRALDGRATPAARPSWSRACGGWRAGRGGNARRAPRRRRRPAPRRATPTSAATSAASRSTADHRHLLHLDERRILCACESCWRCAAAMPSCARPARGRSGSTDFDLPDEIWAAFGIPIGLAFFIDSSATGRRRRPLPEPGRGDRVRARARAPGSELRAANPVLMAARARRRGADRQPDGRPAPARDRPDRRVLPAGRPDQGRTGRGSPAATGPSARSRGSSPSCGRAAPA